MKAGEGGLEAQPSLNRDEISAVISTARQTWKVRDKEQAETLPFPSPPSCSSGSQVLPASAAHSGPSRKAWASSSFSPSICHTPFLTLICHISFKGSGLAFWIPGFIYSSRNMYLYAVLLPLVDLLWRISGGLPSKILNEAKLLPLHFLKSEYRIALQQLTLHSVHNRVSKSARDSPKEKQISSSQNHFRPSCAWWEGHNSTILRTHWARSNQEQFVNSQLEQLHSWRPISSWYKAFG